MAITQRILDLPIVRRSNALRTFITASWLGWQIESNWADPLLFAGYSIARPMASVLILVVMYSVITNGATDEPLFAYIYVGNALYILVGQIISGVSWAVINDREQYRTSRQLYTTPMDGYFYLMGRGVARLLIGLVSVVITIVFGMLVFNLPISWTSIDWPLFLLSTGLGVISLAALGLIVGALSMMMARHFFQVGEAIAGALYLFTGAIFPLEVLPAWLRPVGLVFPVTYWMELARRALLGINAARFPTFAEYSNVQLMGILAVFTLGFSVASVFIYRWCLHRAKEAGFFDMETSY